MKTRLIAFLLSITMLVSVMTGCGAEKQTEDRTDNIPVTFDNLMSEWKKDNKEASTVCWYTDMADQRWLAQRAQDFEKEYGIKVELVYYDGAQLFEDMNQANQIKSGPDVYIMGNDRLEFAITGGMAEANEAFDDAFWADNYPEVSKKALNYKGKQYGYPIYFDTYCLVYDANLLENAPASIDDILAFLDEYEDTGSTKAVFRWDVADPYINSMFIASYADFFGENGDDITSFSVNGEQEVKAMEYFQSLSEYLWMDKTNISHDTVMNRIKEGTLVLGLCKSDMLPVLYEMKQGGDGENADSGSEAVLSGDDESESTGASNETDEGESADVSDETGEGESEQEDESGDTDKTDYRVAYVPSLTAELSSTCFSTTYGAFINPYGNNLTAGNMFALFLSFEDQSKQYIGNGKLPVINQKYHFDEMQTVLYAQYQNSKPVPKTMLLGDYLTESSITFDAIWEGEDARTELDKLQAAMEERMR